MPTYARDTSVSSDQSVMEIKRTLQRFGASGFVYGEHERLALVGFEVGDRRYRFKIPLPDPRDRRFTHTESRGWMREPTAARAEYEKGIRQRYRALALYVKATLEAVESGIISLEEALLSHLVLPQNVTVGETMLPRLDEIAGTGWLPNFLGLPEGRDHD